MATKMCPGCREHVLLEPETWAQRAEGGWRPYCRACDNARSRERYHDGRPRTSQYPGMDRHERKAAIAEARRRQATLDAIRWRIDQYVAVRGTPGPACAAAHELLGRELARYGAAVEHDGRMWRWSRAQADIVSTRVYSPHRAAPDTPTIRQYRVSPILVDAT